MGISLIDDGWCLSWIGIYTSPKEFHSWCSKSPPCAMVLTQENELIFLQTRPLRAGAPGESPWNRPQGCDSHESAYALQSGGSERGRWLHWYLFLAQGSAVFSIEATSQAHVWPYPYHPISRCMQICCGESESNWRSRENQQTRPWWPWWPGSMKRRPTTLLCHRKWWFLALLREYLSRFSETGHIPTMCGLLAIHQRAMHDLTILGCCNPCHFRRIHRNSPFLFTQNWPEFTRIHQNSPEFTRIHYNSPFFLWFMVKSGFLFKMDPLLRERPKNLEAQSPGQSDDPRDSPQRASGALVFGGRIATMWGHPS